MRTPHGTRASRGAGGHQREAAGNGGAPEGTPRGGPGLGQGWPGTGDSGAHGAARRGGRCPAPRPPPWTPAGPPPSWPPARAVVPGLPGCPAGGAASAAAAPRDSGPWPPLGGQLWCCHWQLLLCVARHGHGSGARTARTRYHCGLSPWARPRDGSHVILHEAMPG